MTKMLREHYNIIADALHRSKPRAYVGMVYDQWELIVYTLADALIKTSPRFDRERFIKACNTGV